MKNIVTTSELFNEDEYETLCLPESLCEEIDEAIEQIKSYNVRDDFISSVLEKFISDVNKEKFHRILKSMTRD